MWRLLALALLLPAATLAREPRQTSIAPACVASSAACLDYRHPNHANCGTRGGPGCRKADGRCAAWRDGFTPHCRITDGARR
jgi:hypothetical protein